MAKAPAKEKAPQEPEYTDRIFVRPVLGGYALKEDLKKMREAPRVIKGKEIPWKGGPQQWSKNLVIPATCPCQSLYIHMEDFAPGACSQKHGHQNEAMFYILDGKGHEIHDGKRYDWEAGDAAIVHDACVHRHHNDSPDRHARVLIIKSKPMFNFLNLNFQGFVEKSPKQDTGYRPKD